MEALNIITIFCILSYVIALLSLQYYIPQFQFDRIVSFPNPKLMIGILTELDSPRVPYLQELYANELMRHPKIRINFINYKKQFGPNVFPITTHLNETIPKKRRKQIIRCYDMMYRFIVFARFFLERNISWILRSTDDCFINTKNIDAYIRHLDQLSNPYKTFIVEGDCYDNKYLFLHGGTGWVMSRFAVQKYLEYYTNSQVKEECIRKPYDDIVFTNFLKVHNNETRSSGLHAYSAPFFQGSAAHMSLDVVNWSENIQNGTLDKILPKCPQSIPVKAHHDERTNFMSPITNIVFYHFIIPSDIRQTFAHFQSAIAKYKLFLTINSPRFQTYVQGGEDYSKHCYYDGPEEPKSLQQLYPED